MKARCADEVGTFQDIPNIGPHMEKDFRLLGMDSPLDLIGKDPLDLYREVCSIKGSRQDPCVLDTYLAAVDFMEGGIARPWYSYTEKRKKDYPNV